MHRADARHPGWEFATHVGYSTPEHPRRRSSATASRRCTACRFRHGLPAARAVAPAASARASARAIRTRSPSSSSRQAPAQIDDHADRVEADQPGPRPVGRLRQIGPCHAADLHALGLVQRVPGLAAAASRLDLAEDQRLVVMGDQVDLAKARAVVAAHDRVAEALECSAASCSPRRPRCWRGSVDTCTNLRTKVRRVRSGRDDPARSPFRHR